MKLATNELPPQYFSFFMEKISLKNQNNGND